MTDFKMAFQRFFGGVILLTALSASAQEDLNARDPRLKEGRLFQVKVVPEGKEIKVFLIGKELAEVRLSDVGVQAFVRSGGKMKPVTAKNKGKYLSIETNPESSSDLRLKLDYGGSKEELNFHLK